MSNTPLTEAALPYRGLGSGIPRALDEWPQIELIDAVTGNQFTALVRRPKSQLEEAPPKSPNQQRHQSQGKSQCKSQGKSPRCSTPWGKGHGAAKN